MTAICPGNGPSDFKPGYAKTVAMSTAALAGLAVNWPIGWAVAYYALVAGVTYDLTTMCVVDPPADPGFTAADGLAMINGFSVDANAFATASLKLQQLIQRFAWYQFCYCTGGGTPAPPAAPAAPANLPDPSPNLPAASAAPCYSLAFPDVPTTANNGFFRPTGEVGLNGTPTSLRMTSNTTREVAPGPILTENIRFMDVHGGIVQNLANYTQTGNNTKVQIVPIPLGTDFIELVVQADGGAGTTGHTCLFEVFCNGVAPGSPNSPCCPPDPILSGQLDQILGLVTLIQRQLAPFAYVAKTAHAALSGSGSFAIQGLLGVKIAITTRPTNLGQSGTLPTEYFDLGFITFGTPDGYDHSYRLEHDPELILPPRCSAFTSVAYDLHPGVVVTLTELVREP